MCEKKEGILGHILDQRLCDGQHTVVTDRSIVSRPRRFPVTSQAECREVRGLGNYKGQSRKHFSPLWLNDEQ